MTSELQQIVDSIHVAHNSGSEQMFNLAIQDLHDISRQYEKLELICRFVSVSGDRILISGYLPNEIKIREVNGIQNPVLIEKYRKIFDSKPSTSEFFRYFKHLNDMSPEEYAWCSGVDE